MMMTDAQRAYAALRAPKRIDVPRLLSQLRHVQHRCRSRLLTEQQVRWAVDLWYAAVLLCDKHGFDSGSIRVVIKGGGNEQSGPASDRGKTTQLWIDRVTTHVSRVAGGGGSRCYVLIRCPDDVALDEMPPSLGEYPSRIWGGSGGLVRYLVTPPRETDRARSGVDKNCQS